MEEFVRSLKRFLSYSSNTSILTEYYYFNAGKVELRIPMQDTRIVYIGVPLNWTNFIIRRVISIIKDNLDSDLRVLCGTVKYYIKDMLPSTVVKN